MKLGAIKTIKHYGTCILLATGMGSLSVNYAVAQTTAPEEQQDETGEELVLADSLAPDAIVEISRPFYDYIPDASYELIGERMASMNAQVKVPYNDRVKGFVDYFTIRNREYSRLMLKRRDLYFPMFEKALAKHGMPDDLKYLSIVESGLNPRAKSRVGAAGLWQFMPSTGRIFRLNQNSYVDERLDPEKATEAACRYLKQLYGMFGDWQLALAAYNCGPGNVNKAIRKAGGKKDFWLVYDFLPRETRSYVPQFAAVMYTMRFAEEHNLLPEEYEYQYAQQIDTVHLSRFMSLEALESQLNLCPGTLEALNPELVRKAVPENAGHYALRIPTQTHTYFVANRATILQSTSSINETLLAENAKTEVGSTLNRQRVTYKVKSGDHLTKIASQYGVRVEDIKHWNRLTSNSLRIGQQLAIYASAEQKASINTQLASAQPASKPVQVSQQKVYYVQPGDTLWEISRKHGNVGVDNLKKLNNLRGNEIKVGQKLIITK
ncbi:lytic transglycosylase domain-containing protein [Cesiribacter andamanensis]|uniref:Membrane-bound lytic murein transglycosylase D n=1 Tax=Cesiribacter andamanensis AMV16 TaxID=1279009 RepID=M7NB88_9BACT|nr:lytic transglycosylase domain-containing protein [Cesiribacter andamanensis]EMR04542.1 Membrane-bound lytic murein transglycosylase D precursor [Cesiribacter andamanensis AMV16]